MPSPAERAPLGMLHIPLRDQVRDELRRRIADGRLQPGSKMVERELAEEFGVSRVPVREALRTLETEGFVQVVPRKGVVVRHLSRRDVEELFDVREALEFLATRLATEKATNEELAALRHILAEGEEALAGVTPPGRRSPMRPSTTRSSGLPTTTCSPACSSHSRGGCTGCSARTRTSPSCCTSTRACSRR